MKLKFFYRRPILTLSIYLFLMLFSIQKISKLNINSKEKKEEIRFRVSLDYAGADQALVEKTLNLPLEDRFWKIPCVTKLESFVENEHTEIYLSVQSKNQLNCIMEVYNTIEELYTRFPYQVRFPSVEILEGGEMPQIILGLDSSKINPADLYQMAEKEILPKMNSMKELGKILLLGGEKWEIQINCDKIRLQEKKMDPVFIFQALADSRTAWVLGKLQVSEKEIFIKLERDIYTYTDLEKISILENIKLGDYCIANKTKVEIRKKSRKDGENQIALYIFPKENTGLLEIESIIQSFHLEYAQKGIQIFPIYSELKKNSNRYKLNMFYYFIGTIFFLFLIHSIWKKNIFLFLLLDISALFILHGIFSSVKISLSTETFLAIQVGRFFFYVFHFVSRKRNYSAFLYLITIALFLTGSYSNFLYWNFLYLFVFFLFLGNFFIFKILSYNFYFPISIKFFLYLISFIKKRKIYFYYQKVIQFLESVIRIKYEKLQRCFGRIKDYWKENYSNLAIGMKAIIGISFLLLP